jgi:metal-responsive CopG/Arc/MetJ family transcriptional regulator
MQRITITVDDELVAAPDRVIAACGYQNRSEPIPDLARKRFRTGINPKFRDDLRKQRTRKVRID